MTPTRKTEALVMSLGSNKVEPDPRYIYAFGTQAPKVLTGNLEILEPTSAFCHYKMWLNSEEDTYGDLKTSPNYVLSATCLDK